MSELKDYKVYTTRHEGAWGYHYEPNPNKDQSDIELNGEQVYLKKDADKVIAELEMKLAAEKLVLRLNEPKALYSNLDTMSRLNHKIDVVERRELHQKYKRCLAMARWCDAEVYHIRRTPLCDMSEHEYWQYENDFWQRWQKRWMELAEKFKEE
jgi:hypothetical protein